MGFPLYGSRDRGKMKTRNETDMNEQRENGKIGGLAESLVIAFSMYSRIPMPMVAWTEKGMKYALCFFPAVGIAVGAAVAAFWYLSRLLGLGDLSRFCVETALPLLITGGIHMDGFLDTVDARSSHQSRERKLEILKDPHAGAFAIAGCGVYLLFYAAAFSELSPEAFPGIAGIFVMSRALSGYSVVTFPKAKKDGLVTAFAKGASQAPTAVSGILLCWLAGGFAWILLTGGLVMALAAGTGAAAAFFWYRHMALQEFGGITGDLAGYFLQMAELFMIGAAALAG